MHHEPASLLFALSLMTWGALHAVVGRVSRKQYGTRFPQGTKATNEDGAASVLSRLSQAPSPPELGRSSTVGGTDHESD